MDPMDLYKIIEKGLAYQDEVAVNWCPALNTVLSNEEVIDGVSERGGHPYIVVNETMDAKITAMQSVSLKI